LSIKPEFAERILNGTKRFEFRRSVFTNRSVQTVVLYVTQPVSKIVGEFDIAQIITEQPDGLWRRTSDYAGISREFFDAYFAGRESAHAIEVGTVRKFDEPIDPNLAIDNFTPPQSYMYVSDQIGRVLGDDRQFSLI